MEKLFCAELSAFSTSTDAVLFILREYFHIQNATVVRNENGKPYLENTGERIFFSVSHTKEKLFIAFSRENVGIDAEQLDRDVNYPPILRKFPAEEREEIKSKEDFLLHWTVKESAVKWLGGTLAKDLNKLCYARNTLSYNGLDIPTCLTTRFLDGHVLTICCERDFSNVPVLYYNISQNKFQE